MSNDRVGCLQDFEKYGVRNCSELVTRLILGLCPCLTAISICGLKFMLQVRCLEEHESLIERHLVDLDDKTQIPVSSIDANAVTDYINKVKSELKTVDVDIRDAKRRISVCKPKKSKKVVEEAFDSDQESVSEQSD